MAQNRAAAEGLEARFVDVSGQDVPPLDPWPGMVIPRAAIEAEIERLAALPTPGNGVRATAVVHPYYSGPGNGICPAFDAVINVLKPGEATSPVRKNSNRVDFCIRGEGEAVISGETLRLGKWDTCNIPSMQRYEIRNTGGDLFVWLSFSNAPLLDLQRCHYAENDPAIGRLAQPRPRRLKDGWFDVELAGGARLQSAEYLSDIEVVPSRAHLWPWEEVRGTLAFESNGGGRDIALLYNPATERRAGTSASFFVTFIGGTTKEAVKPPVRWGHRHTPSTVLYQMMGTAMGEVGDEKVIYEAGDLVMLAPAWARHSVNTAGSSAEGGDWAAFALQDHPPHIAQESLIWQDDPADEIGALGLEAEADYLAFSAELRHATDLVAQSTG